MGNDSVASAAGSHPRHRLFGQATPGPSSTLRPAAAAQGKKTTSTHRGKCYEPLDAKRHRYVGQEREPFGWLGLSIKNVRRVRDCPVLV
jgi:hypothetical protein